MIKAYIFDYDDTLVRTRRCRYSAIIALAERYYSYKLSDSDINLQWGKPFFVLFESLFKEVDPDTQRVITRYKSLIEEFPIDAHRGAIEALTTLSLSYFTGIITSANSEVVLSDLGRLGFPVGKIKHIQCADNTIHHKPDPRVFEPLLDILSLRDIARHEVVYVGDAYTDYEAASAAGLNFVGYRSGESSEDHFAKLSIPIVSDLRELIG